MADPKNKILNDLAESEKVHKAIALSEIIKNQIEDLSTRCVLALRAGGKIIFAGNGGSFADSQHLAANSFLVYNSIEHHYRVLLSARIVRQLRQLAMITDTNSCSLAKCKLFQMN